MLVGLMIILILFILILFILYLFIAPFKLKGDILIKSKKGEKKDIKIEIYLKSNLRFLSLQIFYKKFLYIKFKIFWGIISIVKKTFSVKVDKNNELLINEYKNKKAEKYKGKKFTIEDAINLFKIKEEKEGLIEFFSILNKHIKRLKITFYDSKMEFALSNPYHTGIMVAFLAQIMFLYENGIDIYPDFTSDDAYIDGNITIRGKISIKNLFKLLLELNENGKIKKLKKKWEALHGKE